MDTWIGFEEAVAVADVGTFVGAARRLNVSTSHVSRAVNRLEQRMDAQLFNRTTRVVTLTDVGRAFIDQARSVLQDRDALLALAKGDSEPSGEIRLTCSTTLGERYVAPIVRRFAEQFPAIRIDFELSNRVVDLIAEGFDLGVRTGDVNDARLIYQKLATRKLHLCAAPAYLRQAGAPIDLAELTEHECLIGASTTWHFNLEGMERTITPRGRWRCNSGAAILDAAIAGLGICQLPGFYIHQAVADGRLVTLLDALEPPEQAIWAVHPPRRQLLPKVSLLVQHLRRDLRKQMFSARVQAGARPSEVRTAHLLELGVNDRAGET
ncbi:LysR family transcriptional regulator [Sphingobium sp.]|uniref:LysR family transcriptional regulator n=1 Tax=Sphingobium sp. TaxID=1912891 RepID=UPI0028BDCC19|nr:LysR family transcriptional regulator [Sphingobium sp.]